MRIKPITINYNIPYADNLAHAINEYWKMQVAIPDGTRSTLEGNVFMNSVNGIPVAVSQSRRFTHPAIIRVRRGHNNKWLITSGVDK